MVKVKPKCIICKNNKYVNLYFKQIKSWDIEGNFNYFKCFNCSLIFLDPLPSELKIKEYYNSISYWGYSKKRRTVTYWLNKANRDYGYIYKNMNKQQKGNVLDIGMGVGLFLFKLKMSGWNVLGTELSVNARKFAEKYFNLISIKPENLTINKYGNSMDFIVLNNVLEHLLNPRAELYKMKKILKKWGDMVIITPNSKSVGLSIFGRYWYHLDPGRHLYIFNKSNLEILFRSLGFKIIKEKHGYYLHNNAGIFESVRHLYSKGRKNGLNSKKLKIQNKVQSLSFKDIYIVFSKILSMFVAMIEPWIKRGEVIIIYAKKI